MKNNFPIADDIKQAVNPYDFYLSEQGLGHFKRSSGNWAVAGLCPFHDDKTPGSFKINMESGAFKCFSCGEYGGDIITFTMKKYDLLFLDALYKIKKDWGVICV